jgi:hypothetical protein
MSTENDPRQWYLEEQRHIERLRQREARHANSGSAEQRVPTWVFGLVAAGVVVLAAGVWLVQSGLLQAMLRMARRLLR